VDAIEITAIRRLFEREATEYQPAAPLKRETGDPQISLANVRQLMSAGWKIKEIQVRPHGTYFALFRPDGIGAHYAPGLGVGSSDPTLARLAAEAGFGPFERLAAWYASLPEDFDGILDPLDAEKDLQASSKPPL